MYSSMRSSNLFHFADWRVAKYCRDVSPVLPPWACTTASVIFLSSSGSLWSNRSPVSGSRCTAYRALSGNRCSSCFCMNEPVTFFAVHSSRNARTYSRMSIPFDHLTVSSFPVVLGGGTAKGVTTGWGMASRVVGGTTRYSRGTTGGTGESIAGDSCTATEEDGDWTADLPGGCAAARSAARARAAARSTRRSARPRAVRAGWGPHRPRPRRSLQD